MTDVVRAGTASSNSDDGGRSDSAQLSRQCGDNCFVRNCSAVSHPPRPCSTWKRRIWSTPPADLSMQGGANTARALYSQIVSPLVTLAEHFAMVHPRLAVTVHILPTSLDSPHLQKCAVGGSSIRDAVRHELEMPSVGHIDLYIRVVDAQGDCAGVTCPIRSSQLRLTKCVGPSSARRIDTF